MKQAGVKLDSQLWGVVYTAIDLGLGEDVSQVIRRSVRELAKNHGIEVKKYE